MSLDTSTPLNTLTEARFTDLYQRHLPMVRRIAAAQLRERDRDLVDDVAQEVFLRLWAYLRSDVRVLHPAALLATITRHVLVDHYRVRRSTCETAADFADELGARRLPATAAAGDVALSRIEARERLDRLTDYGRRHTPRRAERLIGLVVA